MQTLKPKVIRVSEQQEPEQKNREEIEIAKVAEGKYVIVRTMTEFVDEETIRKFDDEIGKALVETQKNLDAIPGQVEERKKALEQQKEILAKRKAAFGKGVALLPAKIVAKLEEPAQKEGAGMGALVQ